MNPLVGVAGCKGARYGSFREKRFVRGIRKKGKKIMDVVRSALEIHLFNTPTFQVLSPYFPLQYESSYSAAVTALATKEKKKPLLANEPNFPLHFPLLIPPIQLPLVTRISNILFRLSFSTLSSQTKETT